MKLKKFPWTMVIPAVADAAKELLGRRDSKQDLSPDGPRIDMEFQISGIMQRLQAIETAQVDQSLAIKRLVPLKTRLMIAMSLSITAFVISCVALILVLVR